jgi:hypothetical protein
MWSGVLIFDVLVFSFTLYKSLTIGVLPSASISATLLHDGTPLFFTTCIPVEHAFPKVPCISGKRYELGLLMVADLLFNEQHDGSIKFRQYDDFSSTWKFDCITLNLSLTTRFIFSSLQQ